MLTRLPNVRSATDADLDAAAAHFDRLRAEAHPEDPPAPPGEIRAALRNIPATVDVWPWWLCRSADAQVIAECHLFGGTGADAHVLTLELGVDAGHRRQGIATRILREVADVAEANDRTSLRATTTERLPAGSAFCQRLGATPVSCRHTNRLRLADLEPTQLTTWSETAAPAYQLTAIDGPCPTAQLPGLAQILRMVNDDESFSPDRIQEAERMDQAANVTRWLLLAHPNSSWQVTGFTEIKWYAGNPRIIQQDWTFVHPEHRRHGLGRKLKATMLRRILADAPTAEYVDTGNDDTNEPMLAINRALGFRPHIAETTWELGLDRLRTYLA